jgi:cytoskeleton protein RodZ
VGSAGIGTELKKARIAQGLALEDVAQHTKIAVRFLAAIEADAFDHLPGLVFTRNFVRLYAASVNIDADSLLAGLPRVSDSAVQLPAAPRTPRSRRWDSREKSLLIAAAWIVAIGTGGFVLYSNFHRISFDRFSLKNIRQQFLAAHAPVAAPKPAVAQLVPQPVATPVPAMDDGEPGGPAGHPVMVVVTAREASWVSLSADGKSSFAGTLNANETREVAAEEQVNVVAGNAGGLMISLNGKTLDPIGPTGQVRVVKLTAEGPQFPSKGPTQTTPDPL